MSHSSSIADADYRRRLYSKFDIETDANIALYKFGKLFRTYNWIDPTNIYFNDVRTLDVTLNLGSLMFPTYLSVQPHQATSGVIKYLCDFVHDLGYNTKINMNRLEISLRPPPSTPNWSDSDDIKSIAPTSIASQILSTVTRSETVTIDNNRLLYQQS